DRSALAARAGGGGVRTGCRRPRSTRDGGAEVPAAPRPRSRSLSNPLGGRTSAPTGTISPGLRYCCANWQHVRDESAQAAALVVGFEELVRPRGGHRRGSRDLQCERRRGDDLSEPVDLARARAAHQREPRAGVGEGGPPADGADLEPGKANRAVEAAFAALA